jgi:hypothetical protein
MPADRFWQIIEPELALELLAAAARGLAHPGMLWQPMLRNVRRLPGFKRTSPASRNLFMKQLTTYIKH